MSRGKFETARELILNQRYDEARRVLQTIDHPKAQEWMAKVDVLQGRDAQAGPAAQLHHDTAPLSRSAPVATTPRTEPTAHIGDVFFYLFAAALVVGIGVFFLLTVVS